MLPFSSGPAARISRSVSKALGLLMPSYEDQYKGATIESINRDKLDLLDVVLTRSLHIDQHIARIPGARGRNVDPDLEAEVEASQELQTDYDGGGLHEYEACSSDDRKEFLNHSRYPPFEDGTASKDYLNLRHPDPCYDQGHSVHQTFGCLSPHDPFWRHRLAEPGQKLKLGDWTNSVSDVHSKQLADQYIAADNEAARKKDEEAILERRRRLESERDAAPHSPAASSKRNLSTADSAGFNPAPAKRLRLQDEEAERPSSSAEATPIEPILSKREMREAEKARRRKAHDQRNRKRSHRRRMEKQEREEIVLTHISAPGPEPALPIQQRPSSPVPSSPTFSVSFSPRPMSRSSAPSSRPSSPGFLVDSQPNSLFGLSNAPSPTPSAPVSGASSDWEDDRGASPSGGDEGEEIAPEFADDTTPVDWNYIDGLGLTPDSIYSNMPNPSSLPTQGAQGPREEFKLRTTSTGWTGGRAATAEVVALLWAWTHGALGPMLCLFLKVPYEATFQSWTVLKDRVGRIIAVRSPLQHFISGFTTDSIREILTAHPLRPSPFMQQTINEVIEFVLITTPCEYGGNVRGPHWYFISGHDRQIKGFPDLRAWNKLNTGPLKWLFRENSPWRRLTGFANYMVAAFFPGIFRRYMRCIHYMDHKYNGKIAPQYGIFWQFCINWGESRLLVDCWPHVDAANLAIGVCVIYIFGFFDSSEYSLHTLLLSSIILM